MKLDEILKEIGEFGKFQKRLYFLLCLPMINIGAFMVVVIVVLYTPKHRCKVPGLLNDTYLVEDEYQQLWVNRSIPYGDVTGYDKCHIYDTRNVTFDQYNRPINASLLQCSEWVYDQSVFRSTFTATSNLVCGDTMKTSHIQMFFFLGVLVGDNVFGMIGDTFGRKVGLYSAFVSMAISSIISCWVTNVYAFAILQFIVGGACHSAFVIASVIGLELVGPSMRVWTGMMLHVMFTVGLMYISLMNYLIRDWRYIDLACAAPSVLFLSYWFVVPESARWLASKGKMGQYENLLRRVAKVNGAHVSDSFFSDKALLDQDRSHQKQERIWHLLASPVLLFRTIILCFNWFVVGMTFYGVTINAGNMAGDYFMNFFLICIAGFPGYFLAIVLVDKIGRRWCNCLFMFIGGLASISTIFTVLYGGARLQPLTTTLALIGKAGAAGSFGLIYLFTSELLPTVVRNGGMGLCSATARAGAMVAPYIAKSGELAGGKWGRAQPLVVFGACSMAAGLLLLVLPETLKQKLPDTIEEGEKFGRKRRNNTYSGVPLQEKTDGKDGF